MEKNTVNRISENSERFKESVVVQVLIPKFIAVLISHEAHLTGRLFSELAGDVLATSYPVIDKKK